MWLVTWGGKCGWLHGEVSVAGYMGGKCSWLHGEVRKCSDLGIWVDQCSGLVRWGRSVFVAGFTGRLLFSIKLNTFS